MEHIRPMGGGIGCHLMRCSDKAYYVVKSQNKPGGGRALVNDFLGASLAKMLGLPVAEPAVIDVSGDLIRLSERMTCLSDVKTFCCRPGLSFGARVPSATLANNIDAIEVMFDFLPPELLRELTNLSDFCGMLVFDKWTCNTDSRQTVFANGSRCSPYSAFMIDHGKCFGGPEWDFRDHASLGLHYPSLVYESVTGIDAFGPWIYRLENELDAAVLDDLVAEIPPEWYGHDLAALRRMLSTLERRRRMVPDLICETWNGSRRTFPNWIDRKNEGNGCSLLTANRKNIFVMMYHLTIRSNNV